MISRAAVKGVVLVLGVLSAIFAVQCSAFSGSDSSADAGDSSESGVTSIVCVGSLCDCDGNVANGAESDVTQSDVNNCGACNRVCPLDPVLMTAQCNAGVCNPAPVLKQLPYASVVAARGDDVYFADGNQGTPGTVWHAAPPYDAPGKISVPQLEAVTSLAVDDSDVYVVSSQSFNGKGYLVRMPRTGDCGGTCSTTLEGVAGAGTPPLQVALSAKAIFWVRSPSGNDLGQLKTLPKGADAGSALVLDERHGYNSAEAVFPTLVTSGNTVYASHRVEGGEPSSNGVAALPLAGCPKSDPACVADRVSAITAGLAADKDTLYYLEVGVDGGPSHVGRVKDTEKTGTSYIAGRTGIGNILAVDDRDIYWVEIETVGSTSNWRVLRSGKEGKCPTYAPCPQVVALETCSEPADKSCGISAIAIGDTQIFYARGGKKGGVFHTPK